MSTHWLLRNRPLFGDSFGKVARSLATATRNNDYNTYKQYLQETTNEYLSTLINDGWFKEAKWDCSHGIQAVTGQKFTELEEGTLVSIRSMGNEMMIDLVADQEPFMLLDPTTQDDRPELWKLNELLVQRSS